MKTLSCILLIIIFLISSGVNTFGQEKVNISAGFGVPEFFNIGVRYQLEQKQIGLSIGTVEGVFSVSSDFYIHSAGFSKLSKRRPWYGRIGLNYRRQSRGEEILNQFFLPLRVGYEINISSKIGIELDLGVVFLLNEEARFYGPVMPGFGINAFYRIIKK